MKIKGNETIQTNATVPEIVTVLVEVENSTPQAVRFEKGE